MVATRVHSALVIASLLMVGTTLVSCSTKPVGPSSPETTTASAKPSPVVSDSSNAANTWTTLLPGDTATGLKFSDDGQLVSGNTVLLETIPVTYVSDGSALYAKRLFVSEPSPSGNYSFVKGCEDVDPDAGLCWAVFLVDRAAETAYPVTVGKYGGQEWVQWSSDDCYAVLVEKMEGSSWIYVVDLETEASRNLGEMSANVDLDSFQWTGDRTFTLSVDGTPIQVDIDTVF